MLLGVDGSMCFDNLNDALDSKYCFIYDNAVDSADSETYITGRNKLTIEDFMEVKNCTFTTSDIFQQILKVAQENNLFIQFDGFAQDENDTIVVTHAYSDTEFVVTNKQEFDQLIESFNVLEKFERN